MKSEIKSGITVIYPEGNLLGEQSSAPVMETLNKSIEVGHNKAIFNMSNVKFVNSTGLGMLLTAVSKMRKAGGEMVLCSQPEQMKKLMQMTKLETVFISLPDEAAAISFLQSK